MTAMVFIILKQMFAQVLHTCIIYYYKILQAKASHANSSVQTSCKESVQSPNKLFEVYS